MAAKQQLNWLSERLRVFVSVVCALIATVAVLTLLGLDSVSKADGVVFGLLAYLLTYLIITTAAFAHAPREKVEAWAERSSRGTFLQRYFYGSAPGPGVSLFIATCALAVAVFWLPGQDSGMLSQPQRIGLAVALVAVAWASVVVSFAVAYHADNLLDKEQALQFADDGSPQWSDYIYFSVATMATFGATDVSVTSREMRRTVTVNAVIAFVFNTVTVATLVSALAGL